MGKSSKTASKAPAAPKPPAHADLVGKDLTSTQTAFVEHIRSVTGYDVDAKSVQLAQKLSAEFRNSPERKAARDARKAELAELRATADQRRQKRREERAAKLEAQAQAIREGKVRGPGRPRKSESAPASEDVEAVEDDDEIEEDGDDEFVTDDDELDDDDDDEEDGDDDF